MADGAPLRRLIAYNQWADEKILAALDGISDAELNRPVEAYFGTLRKNLLHTLNVQIRWLTRSKGQAPTSIDRPLTGTWREAFGTIHRELHEYAASPSRDDSERMIRYQDTRGNAHAHSLRDLITHLVNHGTQHR